MEFSYFAINDGFAEAICRGLRSGFLTEEDYTKLKNSNNLQDFKTVKLLYYFYSKFLKES